MKKFFESMGYFATFVTLLVGGIQLFIWLSAPAGNLKAEIRYGFFKMPPSLNHNIDSLSLLINVLDKKFDQLISLHPIDSNSIDGVQTIFEALSNAHRKRIDSVELDPSLHAKGYWSINLVNDGDKEIKNVQVKAPSFLSALVTNEDGSTSFLKKEMMISLGDFQPSQKASIFIWTFSEPWDSAIKDFKIRHTEGFASIKAFTPVSGLFGVIARNTFNIWLFTMLASIIAFTISLSKSLPNSGGQVKQGDKSPETISPEKAKADLEK